jgi:hypothetical protein
MARIIWMAFIAIAITVVAGQAAVWAGTLLNGGPV